MYSIFLFPTPIFDLHHVVPSPTTADQTIPILPKRKGIDISMVLSGNLLCVQKFGFINGVDNVNWPPCRDSKS